MTPYHLRRTALTLAGQQGATAAELQARAGHASQAAVAIPSTGTNSFPEQIGETYQVWADKRTKS